MSYSTQSDIEDIFSPINVAAWSRFETGSPSGPTDSARVASALTFADGEINSAFANGPYTIPLVCDNSTAVVRNWAAIIAGVWLYGSRTTASYVDYAGNRFLAMRNEVYADMDLYRAGVKRLDAALKYPHATAPSANQ